MVSFQCNGCADVLTKPKLDKHRAMCHSSFDCIDCSKRFETPADYKGHTSCISEAEKYQKKLYSDGKQNGSEGSGRHQRSRPQGGGRQWGNNRSHWQQQNVHRATGANDTPLGTPVRMSPVNDTPAVEDNTQKGQPAAETPKKRKAEPETIDSKETSEPPRKKKKKQKDTDGVPDATEASVEVKSGKKRKSVSEVTITESPLQVPNFQPVEDGDALKGVGEREKKKKKEKKSKEVKEDEGVKVTKKAEKRKKKEEPSSSGQEPTSVQPPVTEIPPAIDTEEARSTKKKSKAKKSKSKVATADETPDVPVPTKPPQPTVLEEVGSQGDQADRKKKKKRRPGNHHEGDSDGTRVTEGDSGKGEHKEKKKKRKSESQIVSVVG